jgi:hypothetical protein
MDGCHKTRNRVVWKVNWGANHTVFSISIPESGAKFGIKYFSMLVDYPNLQSIL